MGKLTQEEREARKQARKAAEDARREMETQDKALVVDTMRAVLSDPTATPSQKIFAFAVLNYMQYYCFIPHGLPYPDKPEEIDLSRLREKFVAELGEAQTSDR